MSLEKSFFKKAKISLAAITLSAFLFGCPHPHSTTTSSNESDSSDSSGQSTESPQVSENTIVLPDYSSEKISFIAEDKIVLSELTSELDSLTPGKIIVSGITNSTPQGLLRKVKSISADRKTITTENVSLEEVVDNYSFNSTQQLTPSNVRSVVLSKGVSKDESIDLVDFNCPLNDFILYDLDGKDSTKDDRIIANGNISFNSKFNLEFKIENFEMKKLTFKNINSEKVNVTVSSPKMFSYFSSSYNIAHYDFKSFVLAYIPTTPPIPIIITPKLDVDLNINGSSSSTIKINLTQDADLTIGLSYSDNSWAPIKESNFNFPIPSIDFPKKTYTGIISSQKLSLWLYDNVGSLYGQLNEFMDFNSYPDNPDIHWLIQAGLIGKVGVETEIFKQNYSAKVFQYLKTLTSGVTSNAAPLRTEKIQPGQEGKDAYVKEGINSYYIYNKDILESLSNNGLYEFSLIQFQLPQIPSDYMLTSAKLKLYGAGVTNTNANPSVSLKKICSSWNESNSNGLSSLREGDKFSEIPVGEEGWYEWDVKSLVQEWLEGYSNYGIGIYVNGGGMAKFYSSDNSNSEKRPILEIQYY